MKSYRLRDLDEGVVADLCWRNPSTAPAVTKTCRAIFEAVAARGDEAVREYTRQFDSAELSDPRVTPAEFSQAAQTVSKVSLKSLQRAARNIRKFHATQQVVERPVQVEPGIRCWRETRAISSVGLYVPGGNAVLPSTVLMLGIPARMAGCRRVALCVPPMKNGSASPEVLVAAEMTGISEVFKIGGAQAIAALAMGTETVARVDKILGPGNRWVQAAKLLATMHGVAIDMVAGPTEVLVIADHSAVPEWVASDLVAQAEHDADSRAILVSTSDRTVSQVQDLVWRQIEDLPRRRLAAKALKSSFSLRVDSLEEALDFANRYAPEHLLLQVENAKEWVEKVENAGSVFLGRWSPEVAGDYASGPNHTLPTSGQARAFSGVSFDTFVKKVTFQEISRQGLQRLGPTLAHLADLEGLEGHRRAVQIRLQRDAPTEE